MFMALACLGMVMAASAAGGRGLVPAMLKRLALTGIALLVFLAASQANYIWWRRHNLAWLALGMGGLVAVLIPGVGTTINGAHRWINPGLPLGFQPSELAKIALCVWAAAYCERNAARMGSLVHGFLVPCAVVGMAALLILAEPDFGTAVLIAGVCMAVFVVFGTRPLFMVLAFLAALPALYKLVFEVPYRLQRVIAFLDPWGDPRGSGYQLIQSKIAIGSGGFLGLGLGAGHQKAGFLPGGENDFIFSIIGEELGFIGCLAVILLFLAVLWEALKVVTRSRDDFSYALSLGLAMLLGSQAAAHIAVVTGSVPTKGLSLPFVSAGGSSLLASMLAAGILVNIARSQEAPGVLEARPWQEDVPSYERMAWKAWDAVLARGAHVLERLRTRKGEGLA
jgi:cell division protein FtsW